MKNKLKNKKGITLIALIIIVVILVIITAITIKAFNDDEKLVSKARNAVGNYSKSESEEASALKTYDIDEIVKGVKGGNSGGNNNTWNSTLGICEPKLGTGMTGIYWDGDTEVVVTESNKANWYNYKENVNNANDSKWANAKTSDGSYWVWIPRYEYKINSNSKTIDVNFISISKTTATEGYKIHPAFQNGTANNFANGEWDKELSGIWVAKYEMSNENATYESNGQSGGWNSDYSEFTPYIYSSTKFKSVPSVQAATNITIGDCYTYAYNYNRTLESHLMKNSEWGAVAYLTHSKYGRNGQEVSVNNIKGITGSGCDDDYIGSCYWDNYEKNIYIAEFAYNTQIGKLASSTGNITGIYDLSGGSEEYVAAYIYNGNSNLSNGSSFVTSNTSTKYATVYPHVQNNDYGEQNYTNYRNAISTRYGDALTEVFIEYGWEGAWNNDNTYFAYSSGPFFERGGGYAYGSGTVPGVFFSNDGSGAAIWDVGFRAVLAF